MLILLMAEVILRCTGKGGGGKARKTLSIVIAVELLIKCLGVEGLGRAGNSGDDQQRNKGGRDRLHGLSPLIRLGSCINQLVSMIRCWAGDVVVPRADCRRCYAGNKA